MKTRAYLLLAPLNIILGICLGWAALELVVRLNTSLLLRGMSAPSPVETPLLSQEYDVRYSDADAFTWRPDLIAPISPGGDLLEAHVTYQTDEFGFRNDPPVPPEVDVVVLGRSISVGANMPASWVQIFSLISGMKTLNLAQPGASLSLKKSYLETFGLPRHPRWVIVEVAPSLDIIASTKQPRLLTTLLPGPLLRSIYQLAFGRNAANLVYNSDPVYPLEVDLPGRVLDLTCCLHYLEFYTINQDALERSTDWAEYTAGIQELAAVARDQSACVALLVAPTKPDLYFPLALNPHQIASTMQTVTPYSLGDSGRLLQTPERQVQVETIIENAYAGRSAVAAFARQNNLLLIDPTEVFIALALQGTDPFMVYDSHWNNYGNKLVAQAAAQLIKDAHCTTP